jgi:hypothetical protein
MGGDEMWHRGPGRIILASLPYLAGLLVLAAMLSIAVNAIRSSGTTGHDSALRLAQNHFAAAAAESTDAKKLAQQLEATAEGRKACEDLAAAGKHVHPDDAAYCARVYTITLP